MLRNTQKRVNQAKWIDSQKRWRIKITRDGKPKFFYSSKPGRAGQIECQNKADKWIALGTVDGKLPVETVFQEYYESREADSSKTKLKQIRGYRNAWIIPHIGKKQISKVEPSDLQKILNAMNKAGRAKKTIQNCRDEIRSFLEYCVQRGYNVCDMTNVTVPKSARAAEKKKFLEPDEVRILLSSDKTINKGKEITEPNINYFRFMALTGLRPGEARGILRKDVNLKDGKINVTRSINIDGDVTKGKNNNAKRSFVLTTQALDIVKEQMELGKDYELPELFFDLPCYSTISKHWKIYCEYNKITPVEMYALRHTFVSIIKTLPEGEIKALVGHSKDMDTFGTYSHEFTGEDIQVANDVTERFTSLLAPQSDNKTTDDYSDVVKNILKNPDSLQKLLDNNPILESMLSTIKFN